MYTPELYCASYIHIAMSRLNANAALVVAHGNDNIANEQFRDPQYRKSNKNHRCGTYIYGIYPASSLTSWLYSIKR